MAGTEAASRAQEAPREREDTLPSSGHRLTPMYGSGYHTPELTASQNATRSSSPGSGSFHTANPMDSRSEQSSLSGEEEEDGEGKDVDLSVEIPSLEDMKTPLASYQAPVGQSGAGREKEEEEEDANVTLQAEASGHVVGGGESRGRPYQTDQPKLLLAESETVAPCPEKRPLADSHHPSHGYHQEEEEVHETTPLLPPRSSHHTEEKEGACCSCVVL